MLIQIRCRLHVVLVIAEGEFMVRCTTRLHNSMKQGKLAKNHSGLVQIVTFRSIYTPIIHTQSPCVGPVDGTGSFSKNDKRVDWVRKKEPGRQVDDP